MQIAPQIRRPELHGRQPSAVDAAKIKAPLLLHYASLDTRITGRWLAQEEAPKANHMSYTAYVYEGVNHGFHNDMAPRYDEAAHRLKTRLSISITNCGSFGSLLPLGPATLEHVDDVIVQENFQPLRGVRHSGMHVDTWFVVLPRKL